jgi:ketosteroid isomerase-like protein
MEKADVARWLEDYIEAWKTYDRDRIAALFAEDVECRYHPYDQPIRGRDAVVESWFGEGEGAPGPDPEGTYEASYSPIAVDGDVVVAIGSSTYSERPGGPANEIYDNCFVMRFDADGRCREFTEWFMKRPDIASGR